MRDFRVAASPQPRFLLPSAELRGGRDFAGTPLRCRGAVAGRHSRQPGQIPASTDR